MDETITVVYRAVVLNDPSLERGDPLDNDAAFTWGTAGLISTTAPDLAVAEPELTISKGVSPATGQAADTFTVTLDVAHSGNSDADAFDVAVTDVLPTGMTFAGNLSSTAGLAPTTIGEAGGTITVTWNAFDLTDTSQIQFDVTLDAGVEPDDVIQNRADLVWSSLAGDVTTAQGPNPLSTERTGDPDDPGAAANDYAAASNDSVTVDSPLFAKRISSTNQVHTAGFDVAIGELITYEAVLTVPQGTLSTATLVDTPDAGLAIVDVVSITASAGLATSIGSFNDVAAGAVVAADGSTISFDFGTITNSDTDSNVDEAITVRYRASVLNDAAIGRGDGFDNGARFDWSNGTLTDDGEDVTVVEPELTISVSDASPATADAGDVVTFTLNIAHAAGSDAAAMDVRLENLIDDISNHLQYEPGSVNVVSSGGALLSATSDAGGNLDITWSEFPLAATAAITFQARVQNSAPPNTLLSNNATLVWSSLPGDVTNPQGPNSISTERTGDPSEPGGSANDHAVQDAGVVATDIPTAAKTVTGTSESSTTATQYDPDREDLAVGELVTFTITAVLPEGTTSLVISDQLPTTAGTLEIVDVTVSAIGDNLAIPNGFPTEMRADTDSDMLDDRITLDFGSVVNSPDGSVTSDDAIDVVLTARLVDALDNFNGQVLRNDATIDYGTSQVGVAAELDVVEPVLSIDKQSSIATGPAGTTVHYTLVVNHDGTSTADAFDLTVSDDLSDANLTLVVGSVTADRGTVSVGNGVGDSSVAVTLSTLALGESATIEFDALINPDLGAGVAINNAGDLGWDSLAGPGGRSETDNDPAVVTTTAPAIDLSIAKRDDIDPTPVLGRFTYTVDVINLGVSTATGIVVTDSLPVGVTLQNVSSSQGTTSSGGGVVTASIGTLRPNETASITIEVDAPPTAQTLSNSAAVTANENDTDPANNTVVETTEVVPTSDLSGRSWVDTNRDGVFDPGEIALPGVTIRLTGTDDVGNTIDLTTTTAADGTYLFEDLRPGDYETTQSQPTFFIDGDDYAGSLGGTVSNDRIQVTITPGNDATDYHFTELGLTPLGLTKRMLLVSTLNGGINPNALPPSSLGPENERALQMLFAALGTDGDLDGDGDVDADDYEYLLAHLGGVFPDV